MNKHEVDRKTLEKSFSKETKDFYRKFFSDTLNDRILYKLAKFDHGGIFHQNVFLDWYISKWYPFHEDLYTIKTIEDIQRFPEYFFYNFPKDKKEVEKKTTKILKEVYELVSVNIIQEEVAQDIENHSVIFFEKYYPLITDIPIQYKNRFQKRIIEILQKKCHEKLRKNGLFGKISKEKNDKIDFSKWHGWENNQQHYIDFGKQIFEDFNVTHDLHREELYIVNSREESF